MPTGRRDWTLNGQNKKSWPLAATYDSNLRKMEFGCLQYAKDFIAFTASHFNGYDCWQDAFATMAISGSSACAKIRRSPAPRGVVCEVSLEKWSAGGTPVARPDFPCGPCKYWDGALNRCRTNTVSIGDKHYVSCVAPEPTRTQTEFSEVVGKYNNQQNWADVCGKVSGGAFAHLSLAQPSAADLQTIRSTLDQRRYTPGGSQNVQQFGSRDRYYDWAFYNGAQLGQSGCFLVNVKTGEQKDCTTVNAQFPASSVGAYRVLCEQTCPQSGSIGPCFTTAIGDDMKCAAGGAAQKPAGAACDNGSGCTSSSVCNDVGVCVSGSQTSCGGDACAPQTCVKGVGCVALDALDCDDKNPCTQDSCQVVSGKASCVNTVTVCSNDDKPCTEDYCTAGFGCYRPRECDDLDPCTIDSCDPTTGCKHQADPLAAGLPGCGVTPNGSCLSLSADGGTLTVGCQPGGASYSLALPVGARWRKSPMDEVKTATQYKNYGYDDPSAKNLTLTSSLLKLPPGATGVFIAGTQWSVSDTNPPRISGTATGLPQFAFGPLLGFQATTVSPAAPFRVTSGPSTYLTKKHVALPASAWCSFADAALQAGCSAAPAVTPSPTPPNLPADAQWLAFEWDAASAGLDLELAGLTGAQALTAVKKTGPRSVVFSPTDPLLGLRTTDTTLRGGTQSNVESAQWLLSYRHGLEKTTPPLTTLKWTNGVSQISTGPLTLRGHVYTASALQRLNVLGLPMRFQGGLLVDLDPNEDGLVSPDSSKALFTTGTLAAINQSGDSGLDLTAHGEGLLGVDLAFGTFIPNHGEAIGSMTLALDKGIWTYDSRLGQPGTGLRVVGSAKVPALPKVFNWLTVTGSPLAASLFVDGIKPTPDTKPDFRLSLTGNFQLSSVVSGLEKGFVGTILFGTKEVRIDGEITYFGQKLALSGQIQTSTGTFNGDYLLCTPEKTELKLGAGSGLPAGRGRVCLTSTGVTVELLATAESAWTKRDNINGTFYPWEFDDGTFEGLAKCPQSNLIKIYPAGQPTEFCAGYAPQNKVNATTTVFVQLVTNLRITQSRPYGGDAPGTVTSDGYMHWRENAWSLHSVDVGKPSVVPLPIATEPLKNGRFTMRLADPFAEEWVCATLSPFSIVGGVCP